MNIKFDDKTIIDFAKYMAHTDDRQQSIFFNEMGEQLKILCRTDHATEMQLAYMSGHLNHSGCELLIELGGFGKLKKEETEKNQKY